jgi:predicted RNA-binding Zn-ribbon protein involved in translation (DUF1610 family)
MKKKQRQKEQNEYTISSMDIEDDGSFLCPKCGATITPEDETEENYEILDIKLNADELAVLVVGCGKCSSIIRVTEIPHAMEK